MNYSFKTLGQLLKLLSTSPKRCAPAAGTDGNIKRYMVPIGDRRSIKPNIIFLVENIFL